MPTECPRIGPSQCRHAVAKVIRVDWHKSFFSPISCVEHMSPLLRLSSPPESFAPGFSVGPPEMLYGAFFVGRVDKLRLPGLLPRKRNRPLFATGVAASTLLILAHDRPFTGEISRRSDPGDAAQIHTQAEFKLELRSRQRLRIGSVLPAQGDRARRDASGGASEPGYFRRDWPVRCHPNRGAVAWSGIDPDERARCVRDRAGHLGLRARPNGGLIVTGSALVGSHRDLLVSLAAVQAACDILPTLYSSPGAA